MSNNPFQVVDDFESELCRYTGAPYAVAVNSCTNALPAYRLGDLAEAMGAKTITIGLPRWEKQHESMDETRCSKDARRMTIDELRAAL